MGFRNNLKHFKTGMARQTEEYLSIFPIINQDEWTLFGKGESILVIKRILSRHRNTL